MIDTWPGTVALGAGVCRWERYPDVRGGIVNNMAIRPRAARDRVSDRDRYTLRRWHLTRDGRRRGAVATGQKIQAVAPHLGKHCSFILLGVTGSGGSSSMSWIILSVNTS